MTILLSKASPPTGFYGESRAYYSGACSFDQPKLDKGQFAKIIKTSNIEAIYDSLYNYCCVDSAIGSINKMDSTTRPAVDYCYEFTCESNEHVSVILLDTAGQYIKTMINMVYDQGQYRVNFRIPNCPPYTPFKPFEDRIFYYLLIRNDQYSQQMGVLLK